MKVELNPCYILHHRSYRETSLILEVFSREYGRLALVAKGAKRQKNSSRYLLQPNQKLNIAWSIRGDMGTLTAVEREGEATNLIDGWLLAAFYLNELVMRLLHKHESHPELFDAYASAMDKFYSQEAEQSTLRIFEKYLLQSLGYGLVLDHDVVSGKAIDSTEDYYYQIDYGPMLNTPLVSDYVEITGRTLTALKQDKITDLSSLREAKRLMRGTLKKHLGTKPLASRELYKAYMKEREKYKIES